MLANANPFGIWYLLNSNDYQCVFESIKKDRFQSRGASAHINFSHHITHYLLVFDTCIYLICYIVNTIYERFNIWSSDADLTDFAVLYHSLIKGAILERQRIDSYQLWIKCLFFNLHDFLLKLFILMNLHTHHSFLKQETISHITIKISHFWLSWGSWFHGNYDPNGITFCLKVPIVCDRLNRFVLFPRPQKS